MTLPFTRKLTLSLVVAGLAFTVPVATMLPAAPVAAQATSDVNRAAAALRAISTMQADFTQTDRAGQTVRGVLSLKRPGKIRFEYGRGTNMLVVSNGRSLYLVDYDVNQVQRWPISNSPLGALLDPNRDISRYGRAVQTGNPDVLSIEVRDPQRPEFGVITLIFVRDANAPGGLKLTHWVALDAQNNRTTVRLANQRFGMPIADSAFTFRDPRRAAGR
ncbi:outer membrane lipoprotein carrier protein LolA [Porphyrobacter sp. GA68]|uniref:LolA family protein n=1 Tax=Porphyrobacter sp. GA68 TaxID=2883480 RepID=UPI001D1903E6|nr:outer membrane lipoprotein carrier protein LolA [Porphyrobacter sp. GA68]